MGEQLNSQKNATATIHFPLPDIQAFQQLYLGLKNRNRFVLEGTAQKFVNGLVKFAQSNRTTRITTNQHFFRARINPEQSFIDNKALPKSEMSAPLPNKANAGRLNPEGIPYLYLGSSEYTAVAEVRPWVGAAVSIAVVTLQRDLKVVNVTTENMGEPFNPQQAKINSPGAEFTWKEFISYSFSIPFQPNDNMNYIPTQYLAETFKAAGFDGIKYASSLDSNGYNLALFNPDLTTINEAPKLIIVKSVFYKFQEQ
ncbi:MAG TPA: RES family NAD+ phosphorylase [Candidatus Omnitrophota bacterium]|nr:RES family NAD+ phosphorylase [Candidatus Omnitrophota bacterium]